MILAGEMFAVHVSLLFPQANESGERLSRNHLPVLRLCSIIRKGRTIRAWQRCRHCTGRGQTTCTFRFPTVVAMLPVAMLAPQQPPEHLNKRTVFDLPSGGKRGRTDIGPHSLPCRLPPSFSESLGPVETEQSSCRAHKTLCRSLRVEQRNHLQSGRDIFGRRTASRCVTLYLRCMWRMPGGSAAINPIYRYLGGPSKLQTTVVDGYQFPHTDRTCTIRRLYF